MIWSQMKLTPYEFRDLQLADKFENRPGTGQFFTFFQCVVTNLTGAGRRLCMITSADGGPKPHRAPYDV